MKIRKRNWFGLVALTLFGPLVCLSAPRSEPTVNGHPLSYWLSQTYLLYQTGGNSDKSSEEFQRALAAMDGKCIVALTNLLDQMQTEESADRSLEASLLLGCIGPRASDAIPLLEKVTRRRPRYSIGGITDFNEGAAIAALIQIRHDSLDDCARRSLDFSDLYRIDYQNAIMFLGTNAAACMPVFIDAANDNTNYRVRSVAAGALGWIHSNPDLSLPVLILKLKDQDKNVRSVAIFALGQFGALAKSGWKDLAACLSDTDWSIRWQAGDAMSKIDPVAARKLGIGQPGFLTFHP